jgi:hypothetical protein
MNNGAAIAAILEGFLKLGKLGDNVPLDDATKALQDLQKSISTASPVFEELWKNLADLEIADEPEADPKVKLGTDCSFPYIAVDCATLLDVIEYTRAYYESGEIVPWNDPKALRTGHWIQKSKVLIRVNQSNYKCWPRSDRDMFGTNHEARKNFVDVAASSLAELRKVVPYDGRAEKHLALLVEGKPVPKEPPSKSAIEEPPSGEQPREKPSVDRWDELM